MIETISVVVLLGVLIVILLFLGPLQRVKKSTQRKSERLFAAKPKGKLVKPIPKKIIKRKDAKKQSKKTTKTMKTIKQTDTPKKKVTKTSPASKGVKKINKSSTLRNKTTSIRKNKS